MHLIKKGREEEGERERKWIMNEKEMARDK